MSKAPDEVKSNRLGEQRLMPPAAALITIGLVCVLPTLWREPRAVGLVTGAWLIMAAVGVVGWSVLGGLDWRKGVWEHEILKRKYGIEAAKSAPRLVRLCSL